MKIHHTVLKRIMYHQNGLAKVEVQGYSGFSNFLFFMITFQSLHLLMILKSLARREPASSYVRWNMPRAQLVNWTLLQLMIGANESFPALAANPRRPLPSISKTLN